MCKSFFYKSFDFNADTGVLSLVYATDEPRTFVEKITFAGAPFHLTDPQQSVLNKIFFLTHIAFGISYYKGFIPDHLVVQSGTLTPQQARFFDKFYLYGLGEFAVKNNLDLTQKIHFPDGADSQTLPPLTLQQRALVPLGGGKDSCVSVELIKRLSVPAATTMEEPPPMVIMESAPQALNDSTPSLTFSIVGFGLIPE